MAYAKAVSSILGQPCALPYVVFPICIYIPTDQPMGLTISISNYGTSFIVAAEPFPKLYTSELYFPPGAFLENLSTSP